MDREIERAGGSEEIRTVGEKEGVGRGEMGIYTCTGERENSSL